MADSVDPLPIEFSRRELENGWSENASRAPHSALRGHVSRYWSYVERYGKPLRRRELPSAGIILTLSFGPELRLLDSRDAHTSFVAGLTESSIATEMDGVSDGMQVDLTPLGAHRLLGVPMHTLTNRVVSLEDVVGPTAPELLERLHGAPIGHRFDILDSVLAARLAVSARPTTEVVWAWHTLVAREGRVAIKALTDELGWSRKRLVEHFRTQIGLTPKTAARVLRFQRAVRLIEAAPERGWLEIALDCGYYDQAHFNRDFKQFAGSTPSEFVARRLPDGLGLAPE